MDHIGIVTGRERNAVIQKPGKSIYGVRIQMAHPYTWDTSILSWYNVGLA